MKVTLLTNMPTGYRAPLYSRIDDMLKADGGRLTVIYGARWASDRQWAPGDAPTGTCRSIVLPGAYRKIGGRQVYVSPRAVSAVAATRPDVVVLAGFSPWNYSVAAWCRALRVPFLIWSGETPVTGDRSRARTVSRLPLLRAASGFLAYGPDAADYLLGLGVDERRLEIVGNGIDMDAFATAVELETPRREEIRAGLGLTGPTVLSVGGKGLSRAGAAVGMSTRAAHMAVAGKPQIDEELPLLVNLGRLPAAKMPGIYVAADCLLHPPDHDQWPHAINEALTAGLPVVATPRSGVPDDAFSGPGCAVVPANPSALAAAVDSALALDVWSSPRMREAIREPLRRWSVPAMADRWLGAARAAAPRARQAA